jgi:hypothetical protein
VFRDDEKGEIDPTMLKNSNNITLSNYNVYGTGAEASGLR